MKIHVTAHCQTENLVECDDIEDSRLKKVFDFGTKRKTEFYMHDYNETIKFVDFISNLKNEAKTRLLANLVKNSKEHLIGKIHYKFHFEDDV